MDVGAGRVFQATKSSPSQIPQYNLSRLSLMRNGDFCSCSFEQETKNIIEDKLVLFSKVYSHLFYAF